MSSELARCDWKVDARVMDDGEVCWWMIVLDIFDGCWKVDGPI